MSQVPIDFENLANSILAAGGNTDPAEVHGFVCGVLSAGARPDQRRWQRELGEFLDLDAVPADLGRELLQMAEHCLAGLRDNSFGFQLLLDTDAGVAERSRELGDWCQGFLHGFGIGGHRGELPATSGEALNDLGAIAQLDAEQVQEGEAAEKQLAEVQEYVRMAVLNIFTEISSQLPDTDSDAGKTLH